MPEHNEPINITQVRQRGMGKRIPKSTHAYRSDVLYTDRIIGARELSQLSLTELAQLTDISEGDLTLFESGMLQPDRAQLEQIGRATGFPMAWFSKPPEKSWPGIEGTSLRWH